MADATGFMLGEMEKKLPPEIVQLASSMSPEQKMDFYSKFIKVMQTSKEGQMGLDVMGQVGKGMGNILDTTTKGIKEMRGLFTGEGM